VLVEEGLIVDVAAPALAGVPRGEGVEVVEDGRAHARLHIRAFGDALQLQRCASVTRSGGLWRYICTSDPAPTLMRLALILILLPTLSLAAPCCQGTFKEMQKNATCPTPTTGTTSTNVECPGLCCSSWTKGIAPVVFTGCTTNASTWIKSVRAANVGAKAAGFDFAYAEECLLSSSAPAMGGRRPSAASLIIITLLLAVLPFV
jgi:hypothetical protein